MGGAGQGKSGRGGAGRGRGRGSFAERTSFKTTSNPQIQPMGVTVPSLETGQSSNPSQGPLQTERMSSGPVKRTSPETQSSRTLDENVRLSVEAKSGAGSGARDIVNYCGFIMRTTISFRDGNWQKIVLKHGEAIWLRVRDKFEVRNGLLEHKLQGFVISTMQRLFRTRKARLHVIYSSYDNDKDRLSYRPEDVELDDWKHLVEYFGTDEFKVRSGTLYPSLDPTRGIPLGSSNTTMAKAPKMRYSTEVAPSRLVSMVKGPPRKSLDTIIEEEDYLPTTVSSSVDRKMEQERYHKSSLST
ncbi:hypothetical protein BC332_19722 [Capsicum chinense]|nr:hypothetical protein BC332_19722 [Capsicum chinense]